MLDQTAVTPAFTVAEHGVAHVRGVIGAEQITELNDAIESCRANPGPTFRTLSPEGRPVVQSELFRWSDVPAIRKVAMEGALPRLAAEVFGTDEVVLLEDQWFYSAAGSGTPSPWHQDHPYHPLEPWFLTIWIPLDPVPGPVGIRAVPGSQNEEIYSPVEFSAGKATLNEGNLVLHTVPDIDAAPERYSVFVPDTEPGDAVLLDSRTLHAAGGLCGATFRRLSIRYAHPATRFRLRPWPVAAFWTEHTPVEDGTLAPDAFPVVPVPRT
jgi:ectoine hydroxylase-related dioxygenase (phytanoyl-CoA dioxygenase family)